MTEQVVSLAIQRHSLQEHESTMKAFAKITDTIRVDFVRELLQAHFPKHSVAVMARCDYEPQPTIIQMLSADPEVPDLGADVSLSEETLTEAQRSALLEANTIIGRIHGDHRLWAQMDRFGADYEPRHDGWSEFDLALTDE